MPRSSVPYSIFWLFIRIMMRLLFCALITCLVIAVVTQVYDESDVPEVTISKQSPDYSYESSQKFLLYEVNFSEGMNLRRDVYMRIARAVQLLREQGENFILVLPPWSRMYHWKNQAIGIHWKELFDIDSLNVFVPVIEFETFLEIHGPIIDHVVYLQDFTEGWLDGKWSERFEIRECIDANMYYRIQNDYWHGFFYGEGLVKAKQLTCVSMQGDCNTLTKLINQLYPTTQVLFIDRAERVLHDQFGGHSYWEIRRSMRYAKHVQEIVKQYRKEVMGIDLSKDNFHLPENWKDESPRRDALGGDYVSAHLRRREFLRSHPQQTPSIEDAVAQIVNVTQKLHLKKVFVCTDGTDEEIMQLEKLLASHDLTLYRFTSDSLSDAVISVVDQYIAAQSRHFIGTFVSTFSYRIREDREILGFPIQSTFNDFCKLANGSSSADCEQPAKWTIVY